MLKIEAMVIGDPVRLDECQPGLFLFDGKYLGFRSEYSTEVTNSDGERVPPYYQPDAYVVESGEYFWGGAETSLDRSALMVRPVWAEVTDAKA